MTLHTVPSPADCETLRGGAHKHGSSQGRGLAAIMSGHHAVSCVVRCQIRMSGRLLHSVQYHFTFPQVAGPTWHPVVGVQPKLMSARTDHRPSLQHSLDSCTTRTSGATQLLLSHTHRLQGEGQGEGCACSWSRQHVETHTHDTRQ